ncbi:MAG: ImmA/IrrE family metallo-endopeptidase [Tepidanaerobacter acetatoxydans]|uniref:helix-turn-helix domain-containing protein n=1 Tax=Tepidanaerobacter acetatoxydans TaxID=499229 RepID=UPI0026F231A8|nr:XRE family transcriptional regulator [Tepidanaerobacter acetatoxydans]NLU09465.1 ImmA/IrrE family metallo-endopeptidase [Tepidanaerobacter acetatoxydans]
MNNRLTYSKKNIVPGRLRQARIIRGLTMQELADAIGVTRQSVSQYELGQSNPSPAVLRRILITLNFPRGFFFKPMRIKNVPSGTAFYRSYATAKKKGKEQIRERYELFIEICEYLSRYIIFPKANIPNFDKLDIRDDNISIEEIEEIANEVRRYWGLGLGPISNVTLLLEKQGFFITRNITNEQDVDGFSNMEGNRPFIFLSSDKECAVRTRFDVAHELGHIILHQGVEQEDLMDREYFKKIESEAHKFAAAFLLPRESFINEVYSTSIDHFLSLKERWKVSIAAMVMRCQDVGLFTESQNLYLQKQISQRRWRKKEPLDDTLTPENPVLIKQAFEMLLKNNVLTAHQILEDLKLPIEEIESLANLEPGTLSKASQVIPINIKKYR